ncbi:50S ribosomal protein L9 [Nitriliruptor alkaliphilus]|uniref:50S ribosomal protein L9 n=1 Tax=Nitriliruptor alkaliphilus TaxID=427918 RepID=UPI0006984631|nr:50S ribosomal protein L9 [Nitriliruptor alkaliphilus]
MKIILKDEVDNLGLAGDVVDVADGYGRNYLIPRGLAIIATKGAMKEAEALTRSRKVAESKTLGAAEAARETLESRSLRIPVRVDERGHLYGSVTAVDVQRVLRERGHDLERKRIDLRGSIKTIGEYEVPVRVHPQVIATVIVEVVDEEGKVVPGQAAPEHAPLPGEEAESTDALVAEALEAAAELEGEDVEDPAGDAAAAAQGAATEVLTDVDQPVDADEVAPAEPVETDTTDEN